MLWTETKIVTNIDQIELSVPHIAMHVDALFNRITGGGGGGAKSNTQNNEH